MASCGSQRKAPRVSAVFSSSASSGRFALSSACCTSLLPLSRPWGRKNMRVGTQWLRFMLPYLKHHGSPLPLFSRWQPDSYMDSYMTFPSVFQETSMAHEDTASSMLKRHALASTRK